MSGGATRVSSPLPHIQRASINSAGFRKARAMEGRVMKRMPDGIDLSDLDELSNAAKMYEDSGSAGNALRVWVSIKEYSSFNVASDDLPDRLVGELEPNSMYFFNGRLKRVGPSSGMDRGYTEFYNESLKQIKRLEKIQAERAKLFKR